MRRWAGPKSAMAGACEAQAEMMEHLRTPRQEMEEG